MRKALATVLSIWYLHVILLSKVTERFVSYLKMEKQKQKLTSGNQPARSFLASSPAGTHGHISVQCQDLCVFLSLFLPIVKGGVGPFLLYRLVFTYHTLFHLRLHSSQGLSRKYAQFTHHSENTTQHLVLIYTGTAVSAELCSSLCFYLFNR
jgi:hypothetical protein